MSGAGWSCQTCFLNCKPEEDQCPACETFRDPQKQRPLFGSCGTSSSSSAAPIKFGAGDRGATTSNEIKEAAGGTSLIHQTPTFGGPLLFGAAGIKFGATSADQPPPSTFRMGSERVSFGPNGTIGTIAIAESKTTPEPSPPSTPLGGFCRATATPKSGAPQHPLIGYDSDHLVTDVGDAPILKSLNGIVYTWGSGECEQLAVRRENLDDNLCRKTPIVIKRLSVTEDQVERVVCGSMASAAITKDGQLLTWGCSDNGILGRPLLGTDVSSKEWKQAAAPGDDKSVFRAVVPAPVWNIPDRVVRAAFGDCHGVALTESGDCYAWGMYRDRFGPIGFFSSETGDTVPEQLIPIKQDLGGVAVECASGDNHTVVLCQAADGEEYLCFWGTSECGQLAQPPEDHETRRKYLKPFRKTLKELQLLLRAKPDGSAKADTEMMERGKILGVFAGASTTFVRVSNNSRTAVYGFGRNAEGELGVGFVKDSVVQPTELHIPPMMTFTEIAAGDESAMALSSDGSVWVWGRRIWLGQGPVDNSLPPMTIPLLMHGFRNKVRAIACKSKTFFAVSHCGQVFAWGEGSSYQFGNGEAPALATLPTHVPNPPFNGLFVRQIALGTQHVIALACTILRGTKRRQPPPQVTETMVDEQAPCGLSKRARVDDEVRLVDPVFPSVAPHAQEPMVEQPQTVLPLAAPAPPAPPQAKSVLENAEGGSGSESNPSSELQTPVRVTADVVEPKVEPKAEEVVSPPIQRPTASSGEQEPGKDSESDEEEEAAAVVVDNPGESDGEPEVEPEDASSEDEEAAPEPAKAKSKAKAKGKAKAKAKAKPKAKVKAKAKAKPAAVKKVGKAEVEEAGTRTRRKKEPAVTAPEPRGTRRRRE